MHSLTSFGRPTAGISSKRLGPVGAQMGSQHPSRKVKTPLTLCNFQPPIWLERSTSSDAIKASRRHLMWSFLAFFWAFYWPRRTLLTVMDASWWQKKRHGAGISRGKASWVEETCSGSPAFLVQVPLDPVSSGSLRLTSIGFTAPDICSNLIPPASLLPCEKGCAAQVLEHKGARAHARTHTRTHAHTHTHTHTHTHAHTHTHTHTRTHAHTHTHTPNLQAEVPSMPRQLLLTTHLCDVVYHCHRYHFCFGSPRILPGNTGQTSTS